MKERRGGKGTQDAGSPLFMVVNSPSCKLLIGIEKEINDSQALKCQFSLKVF